jgi:hypothetical protein
MEPTASTTSSNVKGLGGTPQAVKGKTPKPKPLTSLHTKRY